MTKTNIKQILDLLDDVQEKLLALPDDMLLQIDPRDNESLKEGTEFISVYNDDLFEFSKVSEKLKKTIEKQFSIVPETEDIESDENNAQSRTRIVAELDKTEPHNLYEDFTYKRPFGYVLDNSAVKGLKTWKMLYLNVLEQLRKKDKEKYSNLTELEQFITKRGNLYFSKNKQDLRVPEPSENGEFFIEINLSVNYIRHVITKLLDYFGIPVKSMKIYLREDRDSDRQEG